MIKNLKCICIQYENSGIKLKGKEKEIPDLYLSVGMNEVDGL